MNNKRQKEKSEAVEIRRGVIIELILTNYLLKKIRKYDAGKMYSDLIDATLHYDEGKITERGFLSVTDPLLRKVATL